MVLVLIRPLGSNHMTSRSALKRSTDQPSFAAVEQWKGALNTVAPQSFLILSAALGLGHCPLHDIYQDKETKQALSVLTNKVPCWISQRCTTSAFTPGVITGCFLFNLPVISTKHFNNTRFKGKIACVTEIWKERGRGFRAREKRAPFSLARGLSSKFPSPSHAG